jgi:GTPase Era involved in 16S rRNA processing
MFGYKCGNFNILSFLSRDSHTYVRALVTTAAETMQTVDLSLLVVDAVKRIEPEALEALRQIVESSALVGAPIVLVLNKVRVLYVETAILSYKNL